MTTPRCHPDRPPAHAFTGVDITFADLSIDAYGSIIVAGAGTGYSQADCAFFVGRISPDGSSWTSRVTPFPFYLPPNPDPYTNAQALLAEIRPDGTILLAGYRYGDASNVDRCTGVSYPSPMLRNPGGIKLGVSPYLFPMLEPRVGKLTLELSAFPLWLTPPPRSSRYR